MIILFCVIVFIIIIIIIIHSFFSLESTPGLEDIELPGMSTDQGGGLDPKMSDFANRPAGKKDEC